MEQTMLSKGNFLQRLDKTLKMLKSQTDSNKPQPAGLYLSQDSKRPDKLTYYYRFPKEVWCTEHYEPQIVEMKDTGLTMSQTMKILDLSENQVRSLLRHGPLWRVPCIADDGTEKRYRKISIKSIVDYLRIQDERPLKKFADFWQI